MKQATIGALSPLGYASTEALNTICSNLSFVGRSLKRIIVTSCEPGDGKTQLTMHIAQNLANRGKRIALVDVDLRRSGMMRRFDIRTEGEAVGLAHYLAGYNTMDEVVYSTNIEGLSYVPIGNHVVNPIPLLNSPEFVQLLDHLAEENDLVFIDSPPIGLVIDAADIAQCCDGSILVVNYGQTRRRMLSKAQKQMIQSGCPIIGCILNKVTFDTISSKKYYSQSYYSNYSNYGAPETKPAVRRKKKKKKLFDWPLLKR